MTRKTMCWLLVGTMCLLLLVAQPTRFVVYHSGYPRAEYRLHLRTASGAALQGVELQVVNEYGIPSPYYPVTDYLLDRVPRSDAAGVLLFHHVTKGVEFSGTIRYRWFLFPSHANSAPPRYSCNLLWKGERLYTIPYEELNTEYLSSANESDAWTKLPRVRRKWQWPHDLPQGLPGHLEMSAGETEEMEFPVVERAVTILETAKTGE